MSITKRVLLAVVVVAVLGFGAVVAAYVTIPRGNTQETTFDAIIVLGYPPNADGSPSPIQRERVLEGVREYRANVAPRLIMTGGAAHTSYVEARGYGPIRRTTGGSGIGSHHRAASAQYDSECLLFRPHHAGA